ncbi:hypothetical protein J6590_087907 [Homalodisca vitripennis]|nr:hypothetical protein J6590_087907 [Homalodisca vitripennis]
MSRIVLQSPSSRVASDLLSLTRSMSSRVIGLITGHGHLRKHLHRVGILQEDPLYRMCDEQDETAEHLLFDCPSIARERYAIFGSLDKGDEFPQEDLVSWCVSGVCKKPSRLKCMAVGRPKGKKCSQSSTKEGADYNNEDLDLRMTYRVFEKYGGKHGNLKLKHGSSDTSFERAHLVELNAANRISKGLSNQKWRVVLGTHCEVHYALPFLTGSSYSDAVGGVSLY